MKKILVFAFSCFSLFAIASCEDSDTPDDNKNTENSVTTENTTVKPKSMSIVGKWFYNKDDDRFYFQFSENGKAVHSYYETHNYDFSSLSGQKINTGTWRYVNDSKTTFTVEWSDSIGHYYDLVSEDSEKLIVRGNSDGPAGRGLDGHTTLLKSAKKVMYSVDDNIKFLIGKWYYDSSKDGRYLSFKEDGTCKYYHYQTGQLLKGWVHSSGKWYYTSSSGTISVNMTGELSYTYKPELVDSMLILTRIDSAAGTSCIQTDSPLYME